MEVQKPSHRLSQKDRGEEAEQTRKRRGPFLSRGFSFPSASSFKESERPSKLTAGRNGRPPPPPRTDTHIKATRVAKSKTGHRGDDEQAVRASGATTENSGCDEDDAAGKINTAAPL